MSAPPVINVELCETWIEELESGKYQIREWILEATTDVGTIPPTTTE